MFFEMYWRRIKMWHCSGDKAFSVATMLASTLLVLIAVMVTKLLIWKDAIEFGTKSRLSPVNMPPNNICHHQKLLFVYLLLSLCISLQILVQNKEILINLFYYYFSFQTLFWDIMITLCNPETANKIKPWIRGAESETSWS